MSKLNFFPVCLSCIEVDVGFADATATRTWLRAWNARLRSTNPDAAVLLIDTHLLHMALPTLSEVCFFPVGCALNEAKSSGVVTEMKRRAQI